MDDKFLCGSCKYYMERIIMPDSPESAEMLGLDPDAFEESGGEPIGHLTCLILGMDLNYEVLECNKYTPNVGDFFPQKPWY